jgi:general secretion pathway protein L
MGTLVVCLPSVAAGLSVSYAHVRSGDGVQPRWQSGSDTRDNQASATAALLPAPERGRELVVVVPAAALSWHAVDLPEGLSATSPRLRVVLGGLLEDRLLDDIDNIHLALAPQTRTAPHGQTWVAACDKTWLKGHLQALESAQRPVSRAVPEFSPDLQTLQLHAVGDVESAFWVMTGAPVGGLMRLPFSASALAVVPKLDEQEGWAAFAEPALALLTEQMLQSKVNLVTRPQRWLDAASSPWDLTQFDLARNARSRTVKKVTGWLRKVLQAPQWRPVRWGALALLIANLVGLNAWAWQQNAGLAASRAALQNTLTQTFPGVKVVVDAPLQMQREVDSLQRASGGVSGSDLETMLAALGGATSPGRSLTSIDFTPGELRVKGLEGLSQNNPQEVGVMTSQLKAKGYAAQLDGDTFVIKSNPGTAP